MTVKKGSSALKKVEVACQGPLCCELLSLPELEADFEMGNLLGGSPPTSAEGAKPVVSMNLGLHESDVTSGASEERSTSSKAMVTRQTISLADLSDLCSDDESEEGTPVEEGCGSPTVFCGVDCIPPQRAENTPKYTVIFDLDETLVYARDGIIRPRPHVDRLFEILKNRCEAIVWTAGVKKYAQQVLERIDNVGTLSFCICRHEAWFQQPCNMGRNYVKDLSILGRDVNHTIIIENTPDCVVRNPLNSIIVSDYLRDCPSDITLAVISNVLDGLLRSNMSVPEYLSTDCNLKLETLRNAVGDTLSVYMLA